MYGYEANTDDKVTDGFLITLRQQTSFQYGVSR